MGWSGNGTPIATGTTLPNPTPTTVAQVQANLVALQTQAIGNASAVAYQTSALQQMHNDLAQSIMANGLFRLVSRATGQQVEGSQIPCNINSLHQANAILTPHSVR